MFGKGVSEKEFPKGPRRTKNTTLEPPDVGLAPTGVWRVPPIPHSNWRTLPSSQTPSIPAPLLPSSPPTPLGSFCKAPGGGGPGWWGGRGPRVPRGGGGGGLQAALGARPTSGGTRLRDSELLRRSVYTTPPRSTTPQTLPWEEECLQFPRKRCPHNVCRDGKSPCDGNFTTQSKFTTRSTFSTAGSFGLRWYVPCVPRYVPFCLRNRKGTPHPKDPSVLKIVRSPIL